MATNNTREDEGIAECDAHAQLLRAVHQAFLDYGLVLVPEHHQQQECPRLTQSSAGAFPPLRYSDQVGGSGGGGGGGVVVVRALTMFDDLIVNATAGGFDGGFDGDGDGDGEVRRRIKLNVVTWSPLFSTAGGEETGEAAATGVSDRGVSEHLGWQGHRVKRPLLLVSCPFRGSLINCGEIGFSLCSSSTFYVRAPLVLDRFKFVRHESWLVCSRATSWHPSPSAFFFAQDNSSNQRIRGGEALVFWSQN